jgi:hypothetical protein
MQFIILVSVAFCDRYWVEICVLVVGGFLFGCIHKILLLMSVFSIENSSFLKAYESSLLFTVLKILTRFSWDQSVAFFNIFHVKFDDGHKVQKLKFPQIILH